MQPEPQEPYEPNSLKTYMLPRRIRRVTCQRQEGLRSETRKGIWDTNSPSPFQAVRNTQLVSPLLLLKARSEANWVAVVVKINKLRRKTRDKVSLLVEEVVVGVDFSAVVSVERVSRFNG